MMNDDAFLKKGFQISTDHSLLDFEAIYNYLNEESYWAQGIPVETMRRAIDESLCFGIYKANSLAAFARVITDKATFAYICDVFVLPPYRRMGLSKWLIQYITEYPDLQGLRRWSLATADAHGLYSQFGFTPLSRPQNWMEKYKPYPSPKKEEE